MHTPGQLYPMHPAGGAGAAGAGAAGAQAAADAAANDRLAAASRRQLLAPQVLQSP